MDKQDAVKKLTLGDVGRWAGGIGVIGLLGAVVLYQNFWKNTADLAERERIIKERREQEVADRAIAIVDAETVAEQARIGAEFAACWPLGRCEGFQQLPIDDEQNNAISRLTTETVDLRRAIREICQGLRDREPDNTWPDCTTL